jgi:hypothetical protein
VFGRVKGCWDPGSLDFESEVTAGRPVGGSEVPPEHVGQRWLIPALSAMAVARGLSSVARS